MKRKLVIFGACQGAALERALLVIPQIRERFDVTRHEPRLEGEALAETLPDYMSADVLLIQDTAHWKRHPMRNRLPADARIVLFQGLASLALWPFDRIVAGEDPGFVQFKPFAFGDHALGLLRTAIPDHDERLEAYRQLSWAGAPTRSDLMRNHTFERARLLRADEKYGSRVGQFMLDHFRQEQLFHAVHHPTGRLLAEFVIEILQQLELYDDCVRSLNFDTLGNWQVPVHPIVAEILQIEWAYPDRLYRFGPNQALTFDQYCELYVSSYG